MKCRDCGLEVPNIGELTKHKKICSAAIAAHTPDGFLIPLALCPEEIKLYSQGKTLGLHISGELTPAGVKVQEVKLIR